MGLLIYAGSMQYVGVGLIAGGASVITTLLTTLMVNARHLFYSISMTALFIASFTEQWLSGGSHIPALAGLLCSLICLLAFGPERFLIPAMLLIIAVLTLLRGRLSPGEEADAR